MDPKQFDAELAELQVRLERLRSLYEQYFLGIERIVPAVARKDVDRRFWAIRKVRINNTAKKFKLQTLVQRYNSLQQHWIRVCREIENGTYARHLAKAKRRIEHEEPPPEVVKAPTESQIGLSIPPPTSRRTALLKQTEMDLGAMLAEEMNTDSAMREAVNAAFSALEEGAPGSLAAGAPPPSAKQEEPARRQPLDKEPARKEPPARRKPPARKKPKAPLQDKKIDALYGDLIAAQSRLNISSKVSREKLAASLRSTEAKLRKKHAGRDVDFRVDIKNGKAIIKPVVR